MPTLNTEFKKGGLYILLLMLQVMSYITMINVNIKIAYIHTSVWIGTYTLVEEKLSY